MDPNLPVLVTEGEAICRESGAAGKAGTSTAIHIDQVMNWLERSTKYIAATEPELVGQVLPCHANDPFETVFAAVFRMLTILKSINREPGQSESVREVNTSPDLEGEPPEVVKWALWIGRNYRKHPWWVSLAVGVIVIIGAIEIGPHVIPFLQHPLLHLEDEVVHFAPSPALKASTETELQDSLKLYVANLKHLGLTPKSIPTVHVQDRLPEPGRTAYLSGNDIFLRSDYAVPASLIHEYGHTLLYEPVSDDPDSQWMYSAIEAGVDNYLTADGLSTPFINTVNLELRTRISDIPHSFQGGQNEGGMAWGSLLWELRRHFKPEKATPAIVRAWRAVHPTSPPQDYQDIFVKELVSAGLDSAVVKETLQLWSAP